MDWLRKLRGRVQGFREGQGQTQSHSDAGRAGDGTQESCLLPPSPQTPFIPSVSIHPFCSLLLPQHQPAYLCSGIPPTLEPASSRKLSKSPHWREGASSLETQSSKEAPCSLELHAGAPLSPEKIHSNVEVLFQNHSKLGFLKGEGDNMSPRGLSHPMSLPLPSHFSGCTAPIFHIRRMRPRERKSLLYSKTRLMLTFPL